MNRATVARVRLLVVAAMVLSGVLALVSASRSWARVGAVDLTGRELTEGLVPALGWLPLVMVALLAVTRTVGRRVLAVLLMLLGAGFAVMAWTRRTPSPELVGGHDLTSSSLDGPWWLGASALVAIAVGPALWWLAPHWQGARTGRPEKGDEPTNSDLWKAMDAGLDPTADHENGAAEHPRDDREEPGLPAQD